MPDVGIRLDTRWRPVSRWGLTCRYGLSVLGWFAGFSGVSRLPWWHTTLDLVVGAGAIFVMRWRRQRPLLVCWAVLVAAIWCVSVNVVAVWALMSLATHRRWRQIALFSAVGIVAALITGWGRNGQGVIALIEGHRWSHLYGSIASLTLTVGTMVAVGVSIGARRDLVASLEARAETVEREQELRVLAGQQAERDRIAREMHDVLAHRLSLISMHAGALSWREDLGLDDTRQIAATIRDNAHEGLEELRAMLGTLRDTDTSARPNKPQPTLADLPQLIKEVRLGGQQVRVHKEVNSFDGLPPTVGRHAYRVIQEGLTNARKHAPNCCVDITISGGAGQGLGILVSNPLPSVTQNHPIPGSGAGLEGLRQRAEMVAGRISAGVTSDSRFELEVWFPW
ncbi:hypothetical protein FYJ43_02275 [Cutibacterium sp. WCA-380-WT-3A]|uniref:histidine kinase n=2 Tax=Cutibacterium porci TaxID=2605781 RepID=A0A7K0J4Q1_9ACTN|nr:hypothetical protein [Cutibacterium porci]